MKATQPFKDLSVGSYGGDTAAIPVGSTGWESSGSHKIEVGNGLTGTMSQFPSGMYQLVMAIAPDTMVPKDGFGRILIVKCI